MTEKDNLIEDLENKLMGLDMNEKLTDRVLWDSIKNKNTNLYTNKIKYLLSEFGTSQPCNRFNVGNTIEFIMTEFLIDSGYSIEELTNAKRVDLCINGTYPISIKYSSTGSITLHNSNSCINTDMKLTDLFLLTPTKLYLITNSLLLEYKIQIHNFLKNTGDSLKLNRNLLKLLEKIRYPYMMDFDITTDKKKCNNRLCSKLFYHHFNLEYNHKNNSL
jgi:hypothetical protein